MYPARSTLERESLRDLEQRLRANGWVEHGADMLESFGGLELCLLRFLRARSLDVDRAAEALSATLEFRRKNEVGSVETVAAVRRDGISNWWCGVFAGVTSTGCPVTYWRFRCIDTDRLKQVDETQLKRYYIAWMEHGLALQREVRLHQLWWILGTLSGEYPAESTQNPGGAPRVVAHRPTGCPGMVDIYDMEGVRWGQMSSGMRLLSGVLSVAQDHYPENLSQAVLVNVPGFFAGTWRLISAPVDKRTQQKIVMCKDGGAEALDAVLGGAQGTGSPGDRESVWRTGDEWLGGGSDEIVQISASSGWVHEQVMKVVPDGGIVGGRRLMWCFYVDGE